MYANKRVGRRLLLAILAVFGVCLLWVGVRGALALHHLQTAQKQLKGIEGQIASGLVGGSIPKGATASVGGAGKHAKAAASLTSDPVWEGMEYLPFFGSFFKTVHHTTAATDLVIRNGLTSGLQAAKIISPTRGQIHKGTVPIAPFEQAAAPIERAYDAFGAATTHILQTPKTHIGAVDKKVAEIRSDILRIRQRLDNANRTAKLIPTMLGKNQIRTYFVGFLNNAEARPQGGLLGSYGILKAYKGHLEFESFGSDYKLLDADKPVVRLSDQFQTIYGGTKATTSWRESVIPLEFADVGAIWMGLFKNQVNFEPDGAIMLDPVTLAYALSVAGPINIKGTNEVLTKDNVVAKTESEAYTRFTTKNQRTDYQTDIAESVSRHLLDSDAKGPAIVKAMARSVTESRLKVYSAHPSEQAIIAATPLAGAIPSPGTPMAYPVFSNVLGNKMDYYLKRSVTYSPAGCGRGPRITITLTNTGPGSGLPTIVGSQFNPADRHYGFGTNLTSATLYVDGTQYFTRATLDGKNATLTQGFERGLNRLETRIELQPGQTRTLVVDFAKSKIAGTPRIYSQPLVIPQDSKVTKQKC